MFILDRPALYSTALKNQMLDAPRGCKVSAEMRRNAWLSHQIHGYQRSLTSVLQAPRVEVDLYIGHPISGGVTASTEMLAAKRHAGVHTPVIACKTISANQQ